MFTVSLYSLYFSLRGLITCGQCPCCLSRTSPITSVSPCLWVNLASKIWDAAWFLCVVWSIYCVTDSWFLSPYAFHWQSEVSCDPEGETSSYSDYHFLIQSSCVWERRWCVPAPHFSCCGSICTLLWWDRISSHYCTLFLKIFIQNKLYTTVPTVIPSLCICIKTSLFAVITGVWNTVNVLDHCNWQLLTAIV